jgi:hypothetical protein
MAAGVPALLAGGWFSLGAPHLTLLNSGLRIDYPWPSAAGALTAIAGAAILAAAFERGRLRMACAALGLLLTLRASQVLLYRLETNEGGIAARSLGGVVAIPWHEVTRVQSGADDVLILGAGDAQVRVRTRGFAAGQRASLDRTIARKVREAAPH